MVYRSFSLACGIGHNTGSVRKRRTERRCNQILDSDWETESEEESEGEDPPRGRRRVQQVSREEKSNESGEQESVPMEVDTDGEQEQREQLVSAAYIPPPTLSSHPPPVVSSRRSARKSVAPERGCMVYEGLEFEDLHFT